MEKTIREHLQELKKILLTLFGILAIGFFGAFAGSKALLTWLLSYYNITAVALNPLETLAVQMKISLALSVIIFLPALLYALYNYCKEFLVIKHITGILLISYLLGLAGLVLGATIFTKVILDSLVQMTFISAYWSLESVIGIATSTSLTIALAMQLFLAIPILVKMGVLSYLDYKTKRLYILVILVTIISFITPDPTMLSTAILTVPIFGSLEGGFMISRFQKGTTEQENVGSK